MKHFSLLCCLLPLAASAAAASDPLTLRQQNIAVIAAFASCGDMEHLETALHRGLDEGLTVGEIKEALVQLYAYCGFPRSLNALGVFQTVVQERVARGIADDPGCGPAPMPADFSAPDAGRRVQTELVGHPVEGGVFDFAPIINQ
ncbi:MAG: carboxymuconolactone decarboxylase family protein [Alistipes sp.]|nr:carboxymuconolactone decarboxylase family protein [Alistipes sp.]